MTVVRTPEGRRKSVLRAQEAKDLLARQVATMPAGEQALLAAMIQDPEVRAGVEAARWLRKPVSMAQFLEDPYYLGDSCRTLFPALRADLILLFDGGYREVILTGGVGVGKSHSYSITVCRVLYDMSCMANPHAAFGLSEGSELLFPLISKNLVLARRVLKTAVDDKIKLSPYFMNEFTPIFRTEETIFPRNIRVAIGSYGAERTLGANVIGFALDECFGEETTVRMMHCGVEGGVKISRLIRMSDSEKKNYKMVGLDHHSGALRSGRWRIRPSTVQELVRVVTTAGVVAPSLEHPVLVRRGDWMVYEEARNIVAGDELAVVEEKDAQGSEDERGVVVGSAESSMDLKGAHAPHGVRPERIRVVDLPAGVSLARVEGVQILPAVQTYAIEAEFKTFIADGVVVHNTNFPPGTKKQQITQTVGKRTTEAHYDVVEKVYTQLLTRVKSRIMRSGGDTPGLAILTSSAGTINSFIDRRVREAEQDPLAFVRDHTQWTARPREHFCGEVFRVMCGTSSIQSRILNEDEEVDPAQLEAQNSMVVEIPVEYRRDFELNLEDSLRDIAGISTQAISAYIQRVEALDACVREDRMHPWGKTAWVAGTDMTFRWDLLVEQVEHRVAGGGRELLWQPLRNPGAPRWIHIDTSLSGDSTGICMSHVAKWVEVHRRTADGRPTVELAPSYVVDFILRIDPPSGEQIFLGDVRQLVYELQEHGFYIIGLTTDQYQCLAGDTWVTTRKGILPLRDVQEGDEVQSRSGWRRVRKAWSFGEQPVLRVTVDDGNELVGTENHRVEVEDHVRHAGNGRRDTTWKWKRIGDLQVGDVVRMWDGDVDDSATPVSFQAFDERAFGRRDAGSASKIQGWQYPKALEEDLAELVGMIFGDGTVDRDGIRVHGSPGKLPWMRRVFTRVFGVEPSEWQRGERAFVRVSARWLVRWMAAVGLAKPRDGLVIPDVVLRSPARVQAAFLRGLFGSDGHVAEDGAVSLSTKWYGFARQVQRILQMRFGIASRVVTMRRGYKGDYVQEGEQYNLVLRGERARFLERIGMGCDYKQEILERNAHRPGRQLRVRVTSLVPERAEVFDLEVEEDPSYVANGFVSHNSADLRQQVKRIAGIPTELQSMDITTQPYDVLKGAIYEGRLELYPYEPVLEELRSLEYDRERGKVDHPRAKSKDLSDSLAGSVFGLFKNSARIPLMQRDAADVEKAPTEQQVMGRIVGGGMVKGPVDPDELRVKRDAERYGAMPVPFLFGE